MGSFEEHLKRQLFALCLPDDEAYLDYVKRILRDFALNDEEKRDAVADFLSAATVSPATSLSSRSEVIFFI